jgi:hypothetical protein
VSHAAVVDDVLLCLAIVLALLLAAFIGAVIRAPAQPDRTCPGRPGTGHGRAGARPETAGPQAGRLGWASAPGQRLPCPCRGPRRVSAQARRSRRPAVGTGAEAAQHRPVTVTMPGRAAATAASAPAGTRRFRVGAAAGLSSLRVGSYPVSGSPKASVGPGHRSALIASGPLRVPPDPVSRLGAGRHTSLPGLAGCCGSARGWLGRCGSGAPGECR